MDYDGIDRAKALKCLWRVRWSADVDAEAVARDLARKAGGDVYVVVARGFKRRSSSSFNLQELLEALRGGLKLRLCGSDRQ